MICPILQAGARRFPMLIRIFSDQPLRLGRPGIWKVAAGRRLALINPVPVEKLALRKFAEITSREEALQTIFPPPLDIFYHPNFGFLQKRRVFQQPLLLSPLISRVNKRGLRPDKELAKSDIVSGRWPSNVAAGGETQEASFLLALAKEPARCPSMLRASRRYKGNTRRDATGGSGAKHRVRARPRRAHRICDMPCPY
jgi:hypothetical protein